jgi:hypothetical protein
MPSTFNKIASITVGSGGASSVDFTSIPATYTDLVIKLTSRVTSSADRDGVLSTFNNTGSGYSFRRLYAYDANLTGTDSGSSQSSIAVGNTTANNATSNTFGSHEIYVVGYTSNLNKSAIIEAIAENNSTSSWQITINGALWSNTAVVDRITLTPGSASFAQHSTATLYGIKNS